jgi:hypothetical protein
VGQQGQVRKVRKAGLAFQRKFAQCSKCVQLPHFEVAVMVVCVNKISGGNSQSKGAGGVQLAEFKLGRREFNRKLRLLRLQSRHVSLKFPFHSSHHSHPCWCPQKKKKIQKPKPD